MFLPIFCLVLTQVPLGPSVMASQTPLPNDAPTVNVEIESNYSETQLIRLTGQQVVHAYTAAGTALIHTQLFLDECVAPCNKPIERPSDTFYLVAPGMTPSDTFSLNANGDDVRVRVKGGSAPLRTWGSIALSTGIVMVLAGGMLWGIDAALANTPPGTTNPYRNGAPFSNVVMPLTLAGGALTLLSIPMIAFSGTKVAVESTEPRKVNEL